MGKAKNKTKLEILKIISSVKQGKIPPSTGLCHIEQICVYGNTGGLEDRIVNIIIGAVCIIFGVSFESIKSNIRVRHIVEARQVLQYFLRKYTRLSLYEIGRITNKNHTTVLHSIKTVNNLKETDKLYREKFNEVKERIEESYEKC